MSLLTDQPCFVHGALAPPLVIYFIRKGAIVPITGDVTAHVFRPGLDDLVRILEVPEPNDGYGILQWQEGDLFNTTPRSIVYRAEFEFDPFIEWNPHPLEFVVRPRITTS